MKKVPVYKVESSVPIPDTKAAWGSLPLSALEVGESFLFPIEHRPYVQVQASRLKRIKDKLFTIKKMDENSARVWRVK